MKTAYPALSSRTLLFLQPQGGLVGRFGEIATPLNLTASQILELCDGNNTQEYIARILASEYGENHDRVLHLIIDFLSAAINKGHVVVHPYPNEMRGFVRGNRNFCAPMDFTVEITSRCSLYCIHCYADAGPNKEIIDVTKILNLLTKIQELGAVKITLTGGDPLAHEEFIRILEYCCSNFLAVDVATNGYLLNEEIAKKMSNLKKIGSLKCNISIDGTEATHDYIRGVNGSWRRAVEAIKLLRKYTIGTTVAMTLNPYNIQELEDVISIARENGAIRFAVGMTVGLGRALGKDLLLTKEQITKANDRLGELAKKYATQEFSVAPWIGRFNSEPVLEESKNISCGAGNRFCFIDCMGNVKPCGMMDLIAGNVSQKTITDICRSPLISSLSEIKCPSKKICGNCENLYFCDGCIANAILKSKETKLCAWLPHWIKYNNAMSI